MLPRLFPDPFSSTTTAAIPSPLQSAVLPKILPSPYISATSTLIFGPASASRPQRPRRLPPVGAGARKTGPSISARHQTDHGRYYIYNVAALVSSWPSRTNFFFAGRTSTFTWKPEQRVTCNTLDYPAYWCGTPIPKIVARRTKLSSKTRTDAAQRKSYRSAKANFSSDWVAPPRRLARSLAPRNQRVWPTRRDPPAVQGP